MLKSVEPCFVKNSGLKKRCLVKKPIQKTFYYKPLPRVIMGKINKATAALIVAILFVSALAGTIIYYNNILNDKNSKIALLKTQIANLNNETANQNNRIANLTSQISNLASQVANLTGQATKLTPQTANLVTALNVFDGPASTVKFLPFNCLYTSGSVTNTGKGTAYNAGLQVIAYTSSGILLINMTVPLGNHWYGTDSTTDVYVSSTGGNGSLQLGSLDNGQTANVILNIFHEGSVSNWTVTPVWTNTP